MTDLNLFTIPSTNHHDNITLSHAGITNPVDPANHSSESYVKPSNPKDMNFFIRSSSENNLCRYDKSTDYHANSASVMNAIHNLENFGINPKIVESKNSSLTLSAYDANADETISVIGHHHNPAPAPGIPTTPISGGNVNIGINGGGDGNSLPNSISHNSLAWKLLEQSPTASQEISQLTNDGWNILWANTSMSITIAPNHVIYISSQYEDDSYAQAAASQIAHELGHALYAGSIDTSSRENYISSSLYDEGFATANNIKISLEVGIDKIPVSGSPQIVDTYLSEYNDGVKSGNMNIAYSEIAQTYGSSEKTGSGEDYSEYYGEYYDMNIKK